MRLFVLTHSLIGSISDRIFILTNQQVVLMGLTVADIAFMTCSPQALIINLCAILSAEDDRFDVFECILLKS